MPSSPMMRTNFSDLLYPGLHKEYMMIYDAYPEEFTKFMNIESSTKRKEEDLIVDGFGLIPEKDEGDQPVFDVMQISDKKEYLHATYVMGYEITEELWEDELYGIMKKASAALALAVRQTNDTLGAMVLNNAFSSSYTGVDGKALCATDHPQSKAGGTNTNTPAVAVDLDATSLYDALEEWEAWTDANDLPLLKTPKFVVSSWPQRRILTQILGSTLQPFVADNEVNAVREWELEKMILHYLTDTDAWFILSPKVQHYLTWFWRKRPHFRNYDDPNTGNARYLVRFRCSYGFTHWPGVYGSPGA